MYRAILNALLKIANERVFHNGGQEIDVALISLFGASDETPLAAAGYGEERASHGRSRVQPVRLRF
jgi:MoxR-vWA-beta-propeller ternary system protein